MPDESSRSGAMTRPTAGRDDLNLAVTYFDGTSAVIDVDGVLGLAGIEPLRCCFHDLTDAGTRHVILDLADAGQVSMTGLGLLLGMSRTTADAGGVLRVITGDPRAALLLTDREQLIRVFAPLDQVRAGGARS
jgi:anti-anti-sigma regulatory factor